MKTWHRRFLAALCLCIAGSAAALMGYFYFRYVSRQVYEESAGHLTEIYGQVNHTFACFVEKNWGNLKDWVHHLETEDDAGVVAFIEERRKSWKFSEFYFLSKDGSYITADGMRGELFLEEAGGRLFEEGEEIMDSETLPSGEKVTVFAVPAPKERYRDFTYTAIAVSYTNGDMLKSLDVAAFSGRSRCFVVHTDGEVLLSPQTADPVDGNYLTHLRKDSDLSSEEVDELYEDWKRGGFGVIRCRIGGVVHYVSYQPVGYEDCVLLGIVPEAVASSSLMRIQRSTVDVLVKLFFLVSAVLIGCLIYRGQKKYRKSALELKYRELMFDTLSTSVDDIFMMLDRETWKVDYISPNIERLLGIPLKAAMENARLIGESVVHAYGFISREEFSAIPIHGSRHWEREHMHQKTGERRWYKEAVYHESIQDMEKFVIVMSDRTKEQQMNQNLQEALNAAHSANEAKSHFLSNMSHDIRTPMNAILGFAALLSKDADNGEKVREYTGKISSSGRHLLSLINDVLDMSKIESGKTSLNIAEFSLTELLEELQAIVLPQARAKHHVLTFHVEGKHMGKLLGDKLRLNQIMINLLSNAVKYTPKGGRIDFTVQEMSSSSPQYAHLHFIVKDNGIGMSREFLETVFDPFAREESDVVNNIQGTGLGMAITKNLVELMGGLIHVDSEPGKGSAFTVELTFALPEKTEHAAVSCEASYGPGEEQASSEPNQEGTSLRGLSILAAEDNELNAELLVELLAIEGADCEVAENGREVLERFLQSGQDDYDMILMDVQMPIMGGYEATKKIRACAHPKAKTIPIVAMTANAFAEDVKKALDSGMDGHLAKPVDMESVRNLLGGLRKRQGES
ncbi:MAG: response regulator [Lachnospiraceae bacterium]|nr:response regulator [Lachnospiraceae bacterium]